METYPTQIHKQCPVSNRCVVSWLQNTVSTNILFIQYPYSYWVKNTFVFHCKWSLGWNIPALSFDVIKRSFFSFLKPFFKPVSNSVGWIFSPYIILKNGCHEQRPQEFASAKLMWYKRQMSATSIGDCHLFADRMIAVNTSVHLKYGCIPHYRLDNMHSQIFCILEVKFCG